MAVIAAAIIGGAALAGGAMSAQAAGDASDKQLQAAREAATLEQRQRSINNAYVAAAFDSSSPLFQNSFLINKAIQDAAINQFARTLMGVDAQRTRRGGQAAVFLNPDIRDQARFRGMLEARSGAERQARQDTQSSLLSAGGRVPSGSGAQFIAQGGAAAAQQEAQAAQNIAAAISKGGQAAGSAFQTSQATPAQQQANPALSTSQPNFDASLLAAGF